MSLLISGCKTLGSAGIIVGGFCLQHHLYFYSFFLLLYQQDFIFSCHSFNFPFPPHGLFFGLKSFIVCQFHRPAGPGIFGAFSLIMAGQPPFQIVCPPGIETSVPAPEYIGIIHSSAPDLCNGRLICIQSKT